MRPRSSTDDDARVVTEAEWKAFRADEPTTDHPFPTEQGRVDRAPRAPNPIVMVRTR